MGFYYVLEVVPLEGRRGPSLVLREEEKPRVENVTPSLVQNFLPDRLDPRRCAGVSVRGLKGSGARAPTPHSPTPEPPRKLLALLPPLLTPASSSSSAVSLRIDLALASLVGATVVAGRAGARAGPERSRRSRQCAPAAGAAPPRAAAAAAEHATPGAAPSRHPPSASPAHGSRRRRRSGPRAPRTRAPVHAGDHAGLNPPPDRPSPARPTPPRSRDSKRSKSTRPWEGGGERNLLAIGTLLTSRGPAQPRRSRAARGRCAEPRQCCGLLLGGTVLTPPTTVTPPRETGGEGSLRSVELAVKWEGEMEGFSRTLDGNQSFFSEQSRIKDTVTGGSSNADKVKKTSEISRV